jgi:hypothetical protein
MSGQAPESAIEKEGIMKVQNRLAPAGLLLSSVTAIDILHNRVRETQNEIDALEDLARHNDMPPEVLRGQSRGWVGRYSSCSSGPIAMR